MKFTIHNVSRTVGGRDIFKDFSLEINSGTRLAVVGPNGAGKTTLLRLLAGLEEADGGRVIIPDKARLGYAAQDMELQELESPLIDWVMEALPSWSDFWKEWEQARKNADPTVLKELGQRQNELENNYGYNPEQRAQEVLSGLGFAEQDLHRPISALSGGWRERARLARPLVAGADFLLLDEPTNHLDLEAVEWLENFLLAFKGVLVFVAHDRVFLDKVGTHVLFLGAGRPIFRPGIFSDFLQTMEEMEEQKSREAKRLAGEINKKMDFVRRFRAKATKARQAASKRKQALRLEKELSGVAPVAPGRTLSFSWPVPKRGDKLACSAVDLDFAFAGGGNLWPTLNFNIYQGQKIALVGPNGCGKSTLLKLICGRAAPSAGNVAVGSLTTIGYFSQHQLEMLNADKTVLAEIRRLSDPKTSEEALRSALGLFLLGEAFFERQVRDLSGGEKNRLILAALFLGRANFLVLDEPTNHLDLESRESLTEALEDYPGTLLFVAHDRRLLERAAEQIWALSKNGGITVYPGGMEEYEQARAKAIVDGKESSGLKKAANISREELKKQKRELAEQRKNMSMQLKPLKTEYDSLERELAETLDRLAQLESTLSQAETYTNTELMNNLLKDYQTAKDSSEGLMEKLERLETEIQAVELKWRDIPGVADADN